MADRLTDAGIRALEPRRARYDVSDAGTPGLTLRVWPNGAKKWSVWYRAKDAARRLSLGPYGSESPALTLAHARKRARQVIADVQRGADPQADKRKAREAKRTRREAAKMNGLLDDFVEDQAPAWRSKTKSDWVRYIEVDIKPALGKRIPAEVTADDVVGFIALLKRKRGPVSVARCFEVLRRVFRWAAARRLIPASPCGVLDAKELVARAKTSDRVYSDDELLAILAGAATTELRLLVPWILYTGARSGEARAAEWAEIDERERVWTVPAEKSKTGVAHRVPLSSGALAVLDEVRGQDGRFLFPAGTEEGHMDHPQKAVERVRFLNGVDDFGLHHLRRTVRQRLSDACVPFHVAESVLGHLPAKIVRTYSPQWEPLREMRAALEAWSRELQRIARGEERGAADVVLLRA